MDEIRQCRAKRDSSIFEEGDGGRFSLKPGVEFAFYSSQAPCGDASMLELASHIRWRGATFGSCPSKRFKTEVMGRGRQDFSQVGIVRSKPGRGDAITTQSMSCR
jgi:tRNA-specific adenosine deaminase 1